MALVSDVVDAIAVLAGIVKKTHELVDAVKDGRKFLAKWHPEAQKDLANLLTQMERAIVGLARVTEVISGFRFTYHSGRLDLKAAGRELARFNKHMMRHTTHIAKLRNNIRRLKANCDRARTLRDKLDAKTESRSWGSMFGLLGKQWRERSTELSSSLSSFYADDQRMIQVIHQTLGIAEQAMKDVNAVLGPPGSANPYNVPRAAETLGVYAVLFEPPHEQLQELADDLSKASAALRP